MRNSTDRPLRYQFWLGAGLLLAGLVIGSSALSALLRQSHTQMAQAESAPKSTAQSTPSTNVDEKNSRDTLGPREPAPEPARPSESTTGSSPPSSPAQSGDALPPAPPEKIGEPISPGSASK